MHIDDWDERFLSEFSPETYVENLKKAKIQGAMIYVQSHVGLTNYPTRVGKMHNAFVGKEDTMRRLFELCHKSGISVVAYYSLVYNTWAQDNHPEWKIVSLADAKKKDEGQPVEGAFRGSRYGLCCPNNPEYREFTKTQIKEFADYAKVDGMFYDMCNARIIGRRCSKRDRKHLIVILVFHVQKLCARLYVFHPISRRSDLFYHTAFFQSKTVNNITNIPVHFITPFLF
jgi:hypothetical protein